jgi:predicted nucleotidyltransferase
MIPNPTPYPDLNGVLSSLVSGMQGALGEAFVGAWLQGSFAVGGFDAHSDVDFLVATQDELAETQVEALQTLHDRTYDLSSEWAQHLEGSYFPLDVLRSYERRGEPLWYLDHGSRTLVRSDHCNTILVRWIVREEGIILAGPSGDTVVDPIPTARLREEILSTLLGWGQGILDDPDPYRNRFYQGFIVLNYARMLHDLVKGRPGSKREGAEWGKEHLDSGWSGLIDRAWECRPDPAVSVRTPPDPEDFQSTLRFVKFIMEESRRRFGQQE